MINVPNEQRRDQDYCLGQPIDVKG